MSRNHYTLRNDLEERGSRPTRDGSLISTLKLFTLLSELSLVSNYTNSQRRPEWKKKSQYSWKHQIESVLLFCITPFPGVEPAHSGTHTAWLSLLCYVQVLSWNTVPWGREIASCLCDKRLNLETELDFASRSWFKNNTGPCRRGLLFLLPSFSQVELIKLSGTGLTLVTGWGVQTSQVGLHTNRSLCRKSFKFWWGLRRKWSRKK